MRHFIEKGKVTPWPEGMRFVIKDVDIKGRIKRKCPCSSTLLHYEVILDGKDYIQIEQHLDLMPDLTASSV